MNRRVNGTDFYGVKRAGRIQSYEYYNGELTRIYITDEDTGEFVRMKTWILW